MQTALIYFQFILLGAVWGGSFLFLRITAPVLGPFIVTDCRVILGTLLIGSYILLLKKNIWGQHPWGKILLLAALSCAIPFTLIAYTEQYLSASLGSILNATTPIYGALLSIIFLKERFNFLQLLGLLLGIAGVIILVGWTTVSLTTDNILGIIAILIATCSYAIGGLYAAKSFKGFPPLILVFWQQVFSVIFLLPFALANIPKHMPGPHVIVSLIALGLLCTGLAFLLYFNLIKTVGAHKTLSVAYIIPVFGMLWGHLFLNEVIGYTTILGAFTILLGIFLIYSNKR
jgi:drug/metabolite transporter (DMT)-like permease